MAAEHHKHPHKPDPAVAAQVPAGLFDNVRSVKYDTGDGVVDAYVLHTVDAHTLVLGRFVDGVLHLVNDGHPVPERAEGGGVTWTG